MWRSRTPAILLRAKAAPYETPAGVDCRALDSEIAGLDRALGPDLDLATGEDKSVSKKVSDMTFDLARGAVSGLIPFRGVVRYVTGAEKRARAINEAVIAGTVRRSYLKGYGEMLGCEYPASPRRAAPDSTITTWDLIQKILHAQAPPLLAPGVMMVFGLIGLAYVYSDARYRRSETK